MAIGTNLLENLDLDFQADQVRDWVYPSPEKGILPYGRGINYFTEGLTIQNLTKRNQDESRNARISQTGYSISRNSLILGFAYWPEGSDKTEQLRFESPVPLDEALSGDQPPITGFYPRVVFPPEGQFKYAILVHYDKGVFGTSFESHKLNVPTGTHSSSVDVPSEIPCEKSVRQALGQFFPGEYFLPEGEYSLGMEIEKMPCLAVRIDGFRPVVAKMLHEGKIPKELPIVDQFPYQITKSFGIIGGVQRENPLERQVRRSDKYIEIPFVIPSNSESWIALGKASLQHGDREDKADLMYVPLRRSVSIAETVINPHLGLIEVQIARVAKVTNINITYEPKKVERKTPELSDILFDRDRGSGFALRSMSFGDNVLKSTSGFHSMSTPVNTGKTVYANPKTGPVSPTIEAEWDSHLSTFRFCLTNNL